MHQAAVAAGLAAFILWIQMAWNPWVSTAEDIATATLNDHFSGVAVKDMLNELAQVKSTNAWIHAKLQDLQTLNASNKLFVQTPPQAQLDRQDLNSLATCEDYEGYFNGTQILVKIPGMFSSALLVSTHSSNQMGAAFVLEMIRSIVKSNTRPRNTLIAFFNADEGAQLCGSQWLMDSKWMTLLHVQAFVNLQVASFSRMSLLHASDNTLASLFAQVAPRPWMNSVSTSILSMAMAPTDYKTYQSANLPGAEIALPHDSLPAIQDHGSNALAFTKSLLNLDFLAFIHANDSVQFFDIMGLVGFVLSKDSRWTLVLFTLVCGCAVILFQKSSPVKTAILSQVPLILLSFLGAYIGGVVAMLPLELSHSSPSMVVFLCTLGQLIGLSLVVRQCSSCVQSFEQLSGSLAIVGSFMALICAIDWPLMYLFPLTMLAYSTIAMMSMIFIYLRASRPHDDSKCLEMQPCLSLEPPKTYSTMDISPPPLQPALRAMNLSGLNVWSVVPVLVYMTITYSIGIDLAMRLLPLKNWFIHCFVVPFTLAPCLYLLLPAFYSSGVSCQWLSVLCLVYCGLFLLGMVL